MHIFPLLPQGTTTRKKKKAPYSLRGWALCLMYLGVYSHMLSGIKWIERTICSNPTTRAGGGGRGGGGGGEGWWRIEPKELHQHCRQGWVWREGERRHLTAHMMGAIVGNAAPAFDVDQTFHKFVGSTSSLKNLYE